MTPNPNLYGADTLEIEILEAGYVRDPNNIYRLPSVHWLDGDPLRGASPVWYAGGPDIWEPGKGLQVQVCSDRIRVFSLKFFGESYTKASYWDTVTVAVFTTTADFFAWCGEFGRKSLPGLPAYANSHD